VGLCTRQGKEALVERAFAGVDVGKESHWVVVLGEEGEELLSRRVENTQEDLEGVMAEVGVLAEHVRWALDLTFGPAALALALLVAEDQEVFYVPGLVVNRSRAALAGEAKTDRRDALVIAENARLRRNLVRYQPSEETVASLRLLVGHRQDLVADRTRLINRLREVLVGVFPGLERTLDLRTQGAPRLLLRYQTPLKIRRAGLRRLTDYLKSQGVWKAEDLAQAALGAAEAQTVRLPAEELGARLAAESAGELVRLNERLRRVDEELEACFFSHSQAKILVSLPGMGPRLGAEFLVAVGSLSAFESADKLAAYAGLAPVSVDSGKVQGRLRRPHGGNRSLKHVFYQSAFASLKTPASRAFYDRKRSEGKRHHQAVLALARRRVNVLWAMLRDDTPFDQQVAQREVALA
jgi:transposase